MRILNTIINVIIFSIKALIFIVLMLSFFFIPVLCYITSYSVIQYKIVNEFIEFAPLSIYITLLMAAGVGYVLIRALIITSSAIADIFDFDKEYILFKPKPQTRAIVPYVEPNLIQSGGDTYATHS